MLNKKKITIVLSALLVVVIAGTYIGQELLGGFGDNAIEAIFNGDKDVKGVSLSHTGYFYDDTIKLQLGTDKKAKIYYTNDGNTPDDKNGKEYDKPIEIKANSTTKATTIKAIAYYNDGTTSDVVTHTYLVGKDVKERFDTLVFSISTDSDNLYDYEKGIFVTGKIRDDFIKENPGKKIEPPDPANYNIRGIEGERPIYVECFDQNGEVIMSQNAGIRTFGGWSRDMTNKSVKLFARSEYDEENNDFDYEFFPNATSSSGSKIGEYKRLVLRNHANDNEFAFMRDELIQNLADQAGVMDTQSTRPVAVFLNSEYYGFMYLHEVYSTSYFEDNYGIGDGEYAVLEGSETYKEVNDGPESAAQDYENMYSYAYKDLTDDSVYNELTQLLDIDNFLKYYATQIYVGNGDWPRGNYKTYRYYPGENDDTSVSPMDGKWRYLLYDTDFGLGLYDSQASENTLKRLLGGTWESEMSSPMLKALLKREDVKEQFVTIMSDFMNYAFESSNVSKQLYKIHAERENELSFHYKNRININWSSINNVPGRMQEIINYANSRPVYMTSHLKSQLNLSGEQYYVRVNPSKGSTVQMNSITIKGEESLKGSYFSEYKTKISCNVDVGYNFEYLEINGKKYTEKEVLIDSSMANDSRLITVSTVVSKASEGNLIISEFSSQGDNDYIMLYNPTSEEISTKGYRLTDDIETPDKLKLPVTTVQPYETIKIVCDNNTEIENLGKIAASFNLKASETLLLSKEDGTECSKILIPKMLKGNCYRLDFSTNSFYEDSK